jgi:mono/diheme cytochrome c family protein
MVLRMKTPSAVRALRARPISAVAVVLVLAAAGHALIAGCGGKSQQSNTEQPTSTQTTPPPSPAPAGTTDGDLGARVYAQRCALCHGPEGKGDGAAAAGLNPKPRNHTDGAYMNSRTNDQLLAVIRNGKGAMPAWGSVLSEEEIQAVLKHVRTLAQPPYPGP